MGSVPGVAQQTEKGDEADFQTNSSASEEGDGCLAEEEESARFVTIQEEVRAGDQVPFSRQLWRLKDEPIRGAPQAISVQ